jgi:hypothetical protein
MDSHRPRSHPVVFCVLWVASSLALMWPMVLNQSPVLFFDSAAYLQFGQKLWGYLAHRLALPAAPSGLPDLALTSAALAPADDGVLMSGRSYFYSAAIWAVHTGQGYITIVMVQSAWIAAILLVALRYLGVMAAWPRFGVVATLAMATPLAFFTSTIMPDVFAAIAPLSIVLLVLFGSRMHVSERLFWTASLMSALLFHKAFLLTATAMAVIVLSCAAWNRWPTIRNAVFVLVVVVMAAGLDATVSRMAEAVSGQQMMTPPFLVARGIGDDTITQVLKRDCRGTPDDRWASCFVAGRIPMTENVFLWGPEGWGSLSPDLQKAVSAEQVPLMIEAVRLAPMMQAWKTSRNIATQIIDTNLSEFVQPGIADMITGHAPDKAGNASYLASALQSGDFPIHLLSRVWQAIYLASLAISLGFLVFRKSWSNGTDAGLTAGLWLLLLSVFVSAAITGGIVGPFGRYQARIAWLSTFVLCVIIARVWAARSDTTRP